MPSFRTGYVLNNFLVQNLNVSTIEVFSGVFLVTMSAGLLFEGIRTFRDVSMDRFLKKRNNILFASKKSLDIPVKFTKSEDTEDISENTSDGIQIEYRATEITTDEIVSDISRNGFPPPKDSLKDAGPQGFRFDGILELSVSTLLHMITVCLGYVLMLAVMTYNVWILVAVSIGTGTGFFIFDIVRKQMITDKT